MAIINAIFGLDSREDQSATLAGTTSTAEIIFGQGSIIAINATADINIKFGDSGMTAASATNFRIPGGATAEFIFGVGTDRVRLYNPGSATLTYWITVLSTN